MSLRTRGSGPPGAKMGAKLKAPLEELDWDRPGKVDLKSHNILADTASKFQSWIPPVGAAWEMPAPWRNRWASLDR